MSENTNIEWATHTFNPVSGCAKVSAGCANCYAASLPPAMRRHAVWGEQGTRVEASESYWRKPIAWNKAAAKAGERHRVFCASVADVFEDRDDLDPMRERLFALIEDTPHLDWLLLTKRPHAILRRAARWANGWPANVWMGTSVEDQRAADERIPHLLSVPARVRFLSMEPLLGPVDLTNIGWGSGDFCDALRPNSYRGGLDSRSIDWVIVGGESGRRARPMSPEWVEDLRDQCTSAGVPFFFKQWGEWGCHLEGEPSDDALCFTPGTTRALALSFVRRFADVGTTVYIVEHVGKHAAGRLLDGRVHDGLPVRS